MDLSRFADLYRNHHPAIVPDAAGSISPSRAWAVMVEACLPFARGTRYRALPAVSFEAGGYRYPSPAGLLPGKQDIDPQSYVQRLGDASHALTLTVAEPLFTDYPLWHSVRNLLAALWRQVGYPVLPVGAALVLTTGQPHAESQDPRYGRLLANLTGGSRATIDGEPPIVARLGDLLYVPPGVAAIVDVGPQGLLLRLQIATDPQTLAADAFDLVADATQTAHHADGTVPYLQQPAAASGEVSAELIASALAAPAFRPSSDLARLRQVQWATRVSAAGLEPVPAPATPTVLSPQHRVRLTSEIFTAVDLESGRERWAVNGHAFTVGGPVPGKVLAVLRAGDPVEVSQLCTTPDGTDNGALPLLERLLVLRAVETVEAS